MSISTEELHRILGQLKDFQRRTVDYVFQRMALDQPPARRFLVADEVGLGKTMVARGIIARTLHHLANRVDRIDVVYVCSNATIAEQNVNRLNVLGLDHVAVATRLTMLPVQMGRLSRHRVNFVSFTPGTTFDLKSRGGRKEERAVLLRMLRGVLPGHEAALFNLLQCTASADGWHWTVMQSRQPIDPDLAAGFAARLQAEPHLLRRLNEACGWFAPGQAPSGLTEGEERYALIGELRHLLARVCVDALQPDLVILDEFQRFAEILHGDGDAAELARSLLSYQSEHGDAVRVLLLSATPYRMLSLNHEVGEDHYTDFVRTLAFLFDDPLAVMETEDALREYRTALYGVGTGDATALWRARERVEALLRSVMVRTERITFTHRHDAMVVEPATPASLTPEDLAQAMVTDRVAEAVGARDSIEYWKSAPYLLSFMKSYELKHRLHSALDDPPPSLVNALRQHRSDLLRQSRFMRYRELDPANARLRALMAGTVDAGQWELLWLPPSLPYLHPGGAYARLANTTKSLVFSSWNVVPDAIAALCSYEAERRMLGEGRHPAYRELYRKRKGLLRFTAGPDGRMTGMPALALLYPCVALAAEVDPLALAVEHGTPVAPDEARRHIRRTLQTRLEEAGHWPGPREGPEDQRWYWAALAALDQAYAPAAARWCRDPAGWQAVGAGHEEEEAESLFARHVELFGKAFHGLSDLGRLPADLLDVLADFALASPAVCALRALRRQVTLPPWHPALLDAAATVAAGFRTLANVPETMGLLRGEDEGAYWRRVLAHGVDGNLQAVLDEHVHVLRESLGLLEHDAEEVVARIAEAVAEALSFRTSPLKVDEVRAQPGGRRIQVREFRLRSRFALRFGDARTDDAQALHRAGTVRQAFNSPFRPFLLATTSVGQEGLDFHPYCHVVYHWNLPSNPVDLEEREGRVHRYKGHAVRKNVAQRLGLAALRDCRSGEDPWNTLFATAVRERGATGNDLVPFWIYEDGDARVERRVPLLPFSREIAHLARLKDRLAVYRLVFGQPRQEDLLAHLERRAASGAPLQSGRCSWGAAKPPSLARSSRCRVPERKAT